jgi:hypothetical protein
MGSITNVDEADTSVAYRQFLTRAEAPQKQLTLSSNFSELVTYP